METNELHRGRLIDHIQLIVADLEASFRFYDAIFRVLDIPLGGREAGYFWYDELFVSLPEKDASPLTGRCHLAFQASGHAQVDAFYRAALEHGGRDNGTPGERWYHPGYYAAFVLDPAGNNIEAVYHGKAKRSSPSVKITF